MPPSLGRVASPQSPPVRRTRSWQAVLAGWPLTPAAPRRTGAARRGPMDKRVCIIGAGSSGIAAAQVLHARGIDFDCFEAGSEVGGNWRYGNDNGMSSAYRVAAHQHLAAADGVRRLPDAARTCRTTRATGRSRSTSTPSSTTSASATRSRSAPRWSRSSRAATGGYDVTLRGRATSTATPASRRPATTPTSSSPTATTGTRAGRSRRSRAPRRSRASSCTRTTTAPPTSLEGKRVLVLGIGNSASDIAVESSRVADETYLAMRRGAHIVPKYLFGVPTDHLTDSPLARGPAAAAAARDGARCCGSRRAGSPTTACPSPTTRCCTRTRRSATTCSPGSATATSRCGPNIDRFEGAQGLLRRRHARPRSTWSSTAPATR